ncbi:hypothetical protein, partial [Reyranella sp.]
AEPRLVEEARPEEELRLVEEPLRPQVPAAARASEEVPLRVELRAASEVPEQEALLAMSARPSETLRRPRRNR